MKSFYFGIFLVMIGFTSCQKSGINFDSIDTAPQSAYDKKKDKTHFTSTGITWLAGESPYSADLKSRIAVTTTPLSKDTRVIFVDMANLLTCSEKINERYQNGCITIVVQPDPAGLVQFMKDNGIVQIVPSTERKVALYAFCKRGAYSLYEIAEKKEYEPSLTESVQGAEHKYEYTEDDAGDTELDPTEDLDFSEIGWYAKPFVDWVNNMSKTANDSEWEGVATYNGQFTYNLDLKVHKCWGSKADRIKGPYTVFANYSYKPVYVYSDQSYSPGDYYSFNATYGCEMGQIFHGDNYVNKHGGIRVHITGAFLRSLSVRTYIDGDGSNPVFISSHEPIPGSDIDVRNYSETKGWNVGGGVTGNFGTQTGKPLATVTPSFNWGYSSSSTLSYSVSDLSVTNNFRTNYNGNGASPAWTFTCQNLPEPSGDEGFNKKTPLIAKSTLSCPTTWIWHTASHKENDENAIGKLVTIFDPYLGAAHNGYCVDGERNYYEIDQSRLEVLFVVPLRIPFGTVRINNTFEQMEVLSDISVCRVSDGVEVFHSSGDFGQENPCEFSVAEGRYNVTMKVTDRNRVTKSYKMRDELKVSRRKSETDIQSIDAYIRFIED